MHAVIRQDAEWFDSNNREEIPTIVANAMIHISSAIGRNYADIFANLVSAAGSLAVAFMLDAPLALIMLCVIPIVAIVMAIISCYLRKSSQEAAKSFASAGALATEAITGIKTVASLCAERWALATYNGHIVEGQKKSVYGGFLSGMISGMTGLLFYVAFVIAFTYRSQQVVNGRQIIGCLDGACRVTVATVMCTIYGVILGATFFSIMARSINALAVGRQVAAIVFATIAREPAIDGSSPKGARLEKVDGAIDFKKVYYAYPCRPKNPIFTNFNLSFKPGSSVAFVGPSGSGKR